MKKILLTVYTIAGILSIASAQYVDQSLIFSQQYYGSTARSKAIGNAFGALGGDFSSLSINPAGIGIYQKSEVSLSANIINLNNTQSTYQGQTGEDRSTTFNFRNFGYVFSEPAADNNSGLVSWSFGVGFNRINNFNQNIFTQAMNSPYSRTDAFAANTRDINSNSLLSENNPYDNVPWESEMAWQTYLIDVSNPDANGMGNQYQSILFQNELVNQTESINREGYINEYPITFGANFNHKLYLGATIGFHDLYYNETRTYSEDGGSGGFGNFDYMNYASTRGFGYNLKMGLIYRPNAALRLGVAIHTPTFYDLKETYNSVMSSNLQNVSDAANGSHTESSPLGDYGYKMESPFRCIGSIAYLFGNKGLISLDYEYVDFSKAKLRNGRDGYNFASENQEISSIYNPVSNIHIGGELKATDALSLRAGYEYFGNPYKKVINNISQPNKDFSFNTINCGLGYRFDNVFIDLSYSLGTKTNYMYIYQVPRVDVSPVKYHSLNHELLFTIGIKL
jgi:long-subunit fatty acid transport protein